MSAAKFDLFIEQGAEYSLSFRWNTGDPSAVVDIQSFTAHCEARTTYDATVKLFDLSSLTSGITITNDNFFVIKIPHVTTSALAYITGKKTAILDEATGVTRYWWKVGVWDFEASSSGGDTTRLLYGDVYVSPEVTR